MTDFESAPLTRGRSSAPKNASPRPSIGAARHESASGSACTPIRLSASRGSRPESPRRRSLRTSRCPSASRNTLRRPLCCRRCSGILIVSAVIPTTAGLPELRAAAAQWLARRFSLRAGRVDARHDGAAGQRHARGACLPLFRRSVDGSAAAAGGDAQSVLSDIRGRGAAGRRRALLPRCDCRATALRPDLEAVRKPYGGAARCCSCAVRAIPPAPC